MLNLSHAAKPTCKPGPAVESTVGSAIVPIVIAIEIHCSSQFKDVLIIAADYISVQYKICSSGVPTGNEELTKSEFLWFIYYDR